MNNDFKPFRPNQPEHPKQNPLDTTPEPAFQSPDQAAAHDGPEPVRAGFHRANQPKKGKWAAFMYHLQHLTKKQKIILTSLVAGLIIASGLIAWIVLREKPEPSAPTPAAKEEPVPPPAPTTVPSRLTGVQVAPDVDKLPTTGVMLENSPDARPQSGLREAGVVFEAIAEGGITRFLALYQEARPGYIGPVRSVRPYYLDFLVPFDAPIAHAGGSAQALAEIRSQGIKDLDHGANAAAFQRVNNRFAPHNLYTSRDALLNVQNSKGWGTSNFTGFTRKAEQAALTPSSKSIDFAISSFLYNPHFDYDQPSNSYIRSEGGKIHAEERSGAPINPKVVIALVMPHRYAGIYSVYGTTGTGQAFVFQDGIMVQGTWQKADRKAQFKFTASNGAELALNPGQTWISVVTSPGAITHKP